MDTDDIEKKLLASDCQIKSAQVAMLTASLNEQSLEMDNLKDQLRNTESCANREKAASEARIQKLKSKQKEKLAEMRQSCIEQLQTAQVTAEEMVMREKNKSERRLKEIKTAKKTILQLEEYCDRLQADLSVKAELEDSNRSLKVRLGNLTEKQEEIYSETKVYLTK